VEKNRDCEQILHFKRQKQFSSIYITYTLLMEAQDNLNEEQLDDGQAAQILADFNDIDIENQAPGVVKSTTRELVYSFRSSLLINKKNRRENFTLLF